MLETTGMEPLYSHRNYLNKAGLLPVVGRGLQAATLNSQDLTRLVIGSTAGRAVDAGNHTVTAEALVCKETGLTLGEAIKAIFDGEPADIDIEQMGITTDGTFAWIFRTDGEKELYGVPRSARRATVFSTSSISWLALKLHFDTQSGWVGEKV
jgi:hypothetical protein